ncbi:unannotated protein [freshwater metagenome]|uniref:Unannotated protein n=1 Tax=freshwater metagenome TaxID=449393 RepID=A0A6J6H8C5_9ZZZZ
MFPASTFVDGDANTGEKDATSPFAPPMAPMQLGPTKRIPALFAIATNSFCATAPASSASANPEDMTITTLTPAAAQSSTASFTEVAGTITSAKSISALISVIFVKAGSSRMVPPFGLTG